MPPLRIENMLELKPCNNYIIGSRIDLTYVAEGVGHTAVFVHNIRVTSNRESGTILNYLGPDILQCLASGSRYVFLVANRDPKVNARVLLLVSGK